MIHLHRGMVIGGQPSARQIRELATRGFASILNLRCEGESGAPIEPEEEGWMASAAGLGYGHVPIGMSGLDRECVQRFRHCLGKLAEPVYVHCREGDRAAMVVLVHVAMESDETLEETLERGAQRGVRIVCAERLEWMRRCLDECRAVELDRLRAFRWVCQ